MWNVSWSTRTLLYAPALDADVASSTVYFSAYVYTTSTSTNYKVTCEALIVDLEGWPDSWTGQVSTSSTGWQNLNIGSMSVSEWYNGVIMECSVGIGAKIGTTATFASAGS